MIKINPADNEWEFLEKNEDLVCIIKNKRTNIEVTGIIKSLTSKGIYTIEVLDAKD